MPRRDMRYATGPASALLALTLVGCAGGGGMSGGAPGLLPYQHSSIGSSHGYTESQITPDRYRIEVKGPPGTPRDRLEKIAATRAAEIGRDLKLGYFKLDGVQQTMHCKSFTEGGQKGTSGEMKKQAYTMLAAEASYAKTPPDPSYLDSKTTFNQYRAELDQAPAVAAPVDPAFAAQCS